MTSTNYHMRQNSEYVSQQNNTSPCVTRHAAEIDNRHPVARVTRPEKNNDLDGSRNRSPEPVPRRCPTEGSRDDRRATRVRQKSGFLDTARNSLEEAPKRFLEIADI